MFRLSLLLLLFATFALDGSIPARGAMDQVSAPAVQIVASSRVDSSDDRAPCDDGDDDSSDDDDDADAMSSEDAVTASFAPRFDVGPASGETRFGPRVRTLGGARGHTNDLERPPRHLRA